MAESGKRERERKMRVPSEAELIEMERRTLCLPEIVEWLERKADNLYDKAYRPERESDAARLTEESNRVAKARDSIERLIGDLDTLLELVRSRVLSAR